MTLNQLIYFETLAEMENMRKAAEKRFISFILERRVSVLPTEPVLS